MIPFVWRAVPADAEHVRQKLAGTAPLCLKTSRYNLLKHNTLQQYGKN